MENSSSLLDVSSFLVQHWKRFASVARVHKAIAPGETVPPAPSIQELAGCCCDQHETIIELDKRLISLKQVFEAQSKSFQDSAELKSRIHELEQQNKELVTENKRLKESAHKYEVLSSVLGKVSGTIEKAVAQASSPSPDICSGPSSPISPAVVPSAQNPPPTTSPISSSDESDVAIVPPKQTTPVLLRNRIAAARKAVVAAPRKMVAPAFMPNEHGRMRHVRTAVRNYKGSGDEYDDIHLEFIDEDGNHTWSRLCELPGSWITSEFFFNEALPAIKKAHLDEYDVNNLLMRYPLFPALYDDSQKIRPKEERQKQIKQLKRLSIQMHERPRA